MQECDPDPQIDNFILFFDSIMTLVSLLVFFHILESTLYPILVHHKVESLIFYDYILLMGHVCEQSILWFGPHI